MRHLPKTLVCQLLVACLMPFVSCGANPDSYVVVSLTRGKAALAGVVQLVFELKLADRTEDKSVAPNGEISFPTAITLAVGSGSGTIELTVHAVDGNGAEVGRGLGAIALVPGATAELSIQLEPPPVLVLTPLDTDLGPVLLGTPRSASLQVQNQGPQATAALRVVLRGADFVIADNGCTGPLAPQGVCTVAVELRPTSEGTKLGTVSVSDSPLAAVSATVRGTGSRYLWDKTFASSAAGNLRGVAVDGSGNLLVAGQFSGTVTIGGQLYTSVGAADLFIAKYDAQGNRQWSNTYGQAGAFLYAQAVAADPNGNVLVVGDYLVPTGMGPLSLGGSCLVTSKGSYDVFVAKYDPSGTCIVAQGFGGSDSDDVVRVAADGSGDVVMAGGFGKMAAFGASTLSSQGGLDIFVAKLSGATLTPKWAQSFGGPGDDRALALALDGSGNALVTGAFRGTADFHDKLIHQSQGDSDFFVAKVSGLDGSTQWAGSYGGPLADYGTGIAADSSGNVLVAGGFAGAVSFGGAAHQGAGLTDVFIAKYNSAGTYQWSKSFGGSAADEARALALDAGGSVLLAGNFAGSASFGGEVFVCPGATNAFVAKYDPAGNPLWSKSYGASGSNSAEAVTADGNGNLLVTGHFQSPLSFGGPLRTNNGMPDLFVLKLTP